MRDAAGRVEGMGDPGLSPNALLVGLIFCGVGFGIGAGALVGSGAAFVFLMSGWVLGLCLHEYGHARAALLWGLPRTGALTLDPLRAPNPVATMLLPALFTIMGGVGFPGGVGMPDGAGGSSKTPLSRGRQSAVAAAGPAMSVLFLVVLALLYTLTSPGAATLRAVLAVSVLFQGTALVLGLMPIPGLDGYGIVRPWLSGPPASPPAAPWSVADRMARHSGLVLLGLFLVSAAFTRPLFRASLLLTDLFGIDLADVIAGFRLVRLW
jgi:Zn-dependent protease